MEPSEVACEYDMDYESMKYKEGHKRKLSKKRKHEDEDSESEEKRLNANSQERIRMQKINNALEELKKCLPEPFHLHHRRMSKIRALRCAMMYIRNLTEIIHEDNMRRQAQYMQAMEFMKVMYDPRFAMSQETAAVQQQACQTPSTVIPYYPYLGPLCAGSESSMYHTPVQETTREPLTYNPRPLDFTMASDEKPSSCVLQGRRNISSSIKQDVDCLIAGAVDTQVNTQKRRRISATATPLNSKTYSAKSETFTSPLLGLRNDNELNLSLLSASSEPDQDDASDAAPLTEIVDGPYHYQLD